MNIKYIFLFLLILTCGCMSYKIPIEDNTKDAYGKVIDSGDYIEGQIYILQQDVYIRDFSLGEYGFIDFLFIFKNSEYALMPFRYAGFRLGPTLDEYNKNPKRWRDNGYQILDIIPAGTKLRFEKLIYHWYFESDDIKVYAVILDGKYKNNFVEIGWISKGLDHSSHYEQYINHEFLAPMK